MTTGLHPIGSTPTGLGHILGAVVQPVVQLICTADEVRHAARLDADDASFDLLLPLAIRSAQAAIEHRCGVARGSFGPAPDDDVRSAAIGMAVMFLSNPAPPREQLEAVLGSALLDAHRVWG